MAGSKKRKEYSQSSTLLDFFAASSVKKIRCSSSAMPKPISKHVAERAAVPEDIIVISDDDEECEKDHPQPNLASKCSDTFAESHSSMFGMPTLLLGNATEPWQRAEDWPTDAQSEPFISEPGLPSDVVSFTKGSDVEAPQYGDWAMGDDEGEEDEEEEEEEEVDMNLKSELCQGTYEDVDGLCPVCGKKLKGSFTSEIERHVNSCIDALSCSTTSEMQDDKHRPLSIVQAPPPPVAASISSSSKPTSAFSVLMSSHKENNAWKEASEAENMKGNTRGRRPAPFYKVMQGMPIAVDAFRYGKIPGVTAYFLTHAHSDHYTNLSSSWKHGPVYCSQTTANLIIHMLNVDPKWVFPLPMDTPTIVPSSGGVEVTLIQANHCPGSVLFLFKGQQTVNAGDSSFTSPFVGSQRVFRYLHCGDFRACPQHVLHSEVKGKRIDAVYLDTTYLDPKYCFPPQPLVIAACAELACRIVQGRNAQGHANNPDEKSVKDNGLLTGWVTLSERGKDKAKESAKKEHVLVVVGTYTIGKERIVKAIAKALSTQVYCDPRKTAVLKCLSDPELHELLTSDPLEAGVHVVPLHVINSDKFQDYLSKWNGKWTKAVGFRPTGWTYTSANGADTLPSIPHILSRDQSRTFTHANLRPMRNSTPTLMLYGVPYSEHSSFFELTCFALSLDWGKMIATVNVGSAKSRGKMIKWFEKWQAERLKRLKPGEEQDIVPYRRADYW